MSSRLDKRWKSIMNFIKIYSCSVSIIQAYDSVNKTIMDSITKFLTVDKTSKLY